MAHCVQVLTTTGSKEEAEGISRALVEGRLAACVQVSGPIESRYLWNGEVEVAHEWRCLAKTTLVRLEAVEAAIRAVHSYDEPEIIATPILGGSEGYLGWIAESVDPGG